MVDFSGTPNAEPSTGSPSQAPAATAPQQAQSTQTATGSLGWRAQFPTESHELLKRFEKPGDFYKHAAELETRASKLVALPEDTDTEAKNQFYNKLGRPESPDKYDFKKAEGLNYSDEAEATFRKQAHELGLTQKQAQAIWDMDTERGKKIVEARAKALQQSKEAQAAAEAKAKEELNKAWGDKTTENLEKVKRTLDKIGKPQLAEKLTKSGLHQDPDVLGLFLNLYELTADGGLVAGARNGSQADDVNWYPNTNFN